MSRGADLWKRLAPRQQLLLVAATGVTAAVLLLRFVYIPLWGGIRQRAARLRELDVKMADAHLVRDQLAGQDALLRKTRERYELVRSRIGDEQSVGRILEALNQQAVEQQLEVLGMQPGVDGREPERLRLNADLTLREVPVLLRLQGRYRNLGEFLGQLPDAPFLASVRELELKRAPAGSPQLEARVVLSVYVTESAGAVQALSPDRSGS
ncbi:MAG: type 4a pilus biogenesis protein PilO [Candidatus Omnitrophica bacterium]|nr:type 4a pilus biogenesis protein PilO [Candidatus Omnitrophota bacterium]